METLISSQSSHFVFNLTHASDVAAVRRAGQKVADSLGFNDLKAGQLALIITEAATNILKHAGEGAMHVGPAQSPAGIGVDVLALDKGPGIADIDNCLLDGVSSAGTAGTGRSIARVDVRIEAGNRRRAISAAPAALRRSASGSSGLP